MRNPPTAEPVLPVAAADFASCQAALSDVDGARLAACPFVFVGVGAVGGPLAEDLAYLGMRRCVLIDPKAYQARSMALQCDPHEVGTPKAAAVARRLGHLGVR